MGTFLLRVRRSGWWALPAALALLAAALWPSMALAHATLLRSDPPDGAVLAAAPSQVRLWFSEPVALVFTTLELVDGDGRRIPVTARADAASLAAAARFGAANPPAPLVVDLPALAPNVYRLSWRTLSNNDPHIASGSVVFGVQRPADLAPVAAAAPVPSPLEVGLRWLNLGALAVLIGALAVALLATTDHRRPTTDEDAAQHVSRSTFSILRFTRVRQRLLRLAFYSALLALVAGTGWLLAQAAAGGPGPASIAEVALRIIGGTSFGARWLLGQGMLAALGATILLLLHQTADAALTPPYPLNAPPYARLASPYTVPPVPHAAPTLPHAASFANIARERRPARYAAQALAAALILALAIVQALNSHAAAFNDLSAARILATALHLLAAGLWAGGVLALALAVVPLLRGDQDDAALAWTILRRFGALAAAALAALLVSGLFMSGQQVASLDALLTTLYGRTLLLKGTLVLGIALLGLCNATMLHPRRAAALRWPAIVQLQSVHCRLRIGARHTEGIGATTHPNRLPDFALGERKSTAPFLPLSREKGGEGQRRLTRTIWSEAAGALGLLLLAAMLSATPPARGPAFDPPVEAVASATTNADDLVVTLAVKPNRPGRNFVSLGVFNTRRPAPAAIESVAVRLVAPGEMGAGAPLVAEPLGGGHYQVVGSSLQSAGDWQIAVVVKRPGMPNTTATIDWTMPHPSAPLGGRPVLVSNRPLAPVLTLAAVAGALLLGSVAILLWLQRRLPAALALAQSFLARRHLRPLRKE